jgi:hypothetical protein
MEPSTPPLAVDSQMQVRKNAALKGGFDKAQAMRHYDNLR